MRWPLFFILFAPLSWATNPNEMLSDKELSKKFVSIIKENEIEKLIKNTKDFQECRDKNPYKADASSSEKEQQIKDAQECFVKKIEGKPTKDIQKLSEQLGLESYQLVKSKNVKDITSYLGDRMYKALAGISENDKRTEAQLANLQFKDRKIVDQVHFFKLYSYQLTKNALMEVSRYCFQNFQNTTKTNEISPSTSNFADHWKDYFDNNPNLTVSDDGNHKWGDLSATDADPSAVYGKIFSSFGNIDPKKLGEFWGFCTKSMKRMCDEYKTDSGQSHGANSCLTMNRLRNMRNAIADTEAIQKQLDDNGTKGRGINVAYNPFKAENDTSYDNLTNFTSNDLLTGKVDKKLTDLATQCQDNPAHPDCDNFIAQGGASIDETIHKIDQEMRFKQEIEIKKILEISKQDLKEYLEKNGYFDLAQKENISDDDIKKFIAREFDAKRVAVTKQLKERVGSRQIADDAKEENKTAKIVTSAKETQEERARLAQVILFNNIITSNLDLKNTEGKELGKNTGAWKKESDSLAKSNIDQSLYQNIQSAIDTEGSSSNNRSITGTEFLDSIIGKAPPETKAK